MEQGPLGLNPELRTPPLPATHVRAGTGHRVLARNYTTDKVGPPTCEFTRYVRPRVATSWTHPTLRNGHVEDPRPAPFPLGYGQKGPPRREPSRIDRKSLRHVLHGNNPRSLTRRLQAKLNPRADRTKEDTACTQASPTPFSTPRGGPGRGLAKLTRR